MSWIVFGPGGPYHTAEEPTENANHSLTITEGKHKGLCLAAGTWQKRGSDGPVREMPHGVTGTSSQRPKRENPADGFARRNT